MQKHVPAWKRIGLKLKYARDNVISNGIENTSSPVASPGGKIEFQSKELRPEAEHRPSKKRRVSVSSGKSDFSRLESSTEESSSTSHKEAATSSNALISTETTSAAAPEVPSYLHVQQSRNTVNTNLEPKANVVARRKSVSFAPETKREDDGNVAQADEHSSLVQRDYPDSGDTPTSQKRSKKSNRRERTNVSKHSIASQEAKEGPAYLRYLQLFYSDRDSWKFNKSKQNGLLKNLFDIDSLPAEHDPAILQYVEGLQGNAARDRVIADADSVLQTFLRDGETFTESGEMELEERRRAAYGAALDREVQRYEALRSGPSEYDKQQLDEMKQKTQRGRRAEAVLRTLLEQGSRPSKSTKGVNGGNGEALEAIQAQTESLPKRKNRKARTQASSETSSSDEGEKEEVSSRSQALARTQSTTESRAQTNDGVESRSKTGSKLNLAVKPAGKKTIFDDDLLDKIFPKQKSYHDTAPKRKASQISKARGFAYIHGTRADKSDSEDD